MVEFGCVRSIQGGVFRGPHTVVRSHVSLRVLILGKLTVDRDRSHRF